jgi:quercetin dioxygenase-like cupin family protein
LCEGGSTRFETRYFELGPGGYTTHEVHKHEHVVVVLRGHGRVLLDGEWSEIGPGDAVRVVSGTPHQFRNDRDEPFGILCIVDRDRDRPVPFAGAGDTAEASGTSG